jgi:hypothetical protein
MKIAFKYSIVVGLALCAWDIYTNESLYNTVFGRVPFVFQLLILLLGLLGAIWETKYKQYNGKITFGQGSLAGIKVAFLASAIFSIGSYMYYQRGVYRFDEYSINETIRVAKEKKASAAEMKKVEELVAMTRAAETPANKAKGALLVTSVLGILFSLIFAAIFRNMDPIPLSER